MHSAFCFIFLSKFQKEFNKGYRNTTFLFVILKFTFYLVFLFFFNWKKSKVYLSSKQICKHNISFKLVFEAPGTLEGWDNIVSSATKFLLMTSHDSSLGRYVTKGKFKSLLEWFLSLYFGVTLPNVPIASFYVSMWLPGWDMEQGRGSHSKICVKYQRQARSCTCNFKSRLFNDVFLLWLKLMSWRKMPWWKRMEKLLKPRTQQT